MAAAIGEPGSRIDEIHRLLEMIPDAALVLDRDGQVVAANSELQNVFGYGPDEIVGRSVEVLLPERFRGVHMGHRNDYAVSPRRRPMGHGIEPFGLRKDGGEFPVEISLNPFATDDGSLVCATIRDVTERKEAGRASHATAQRYQAIFENAAEGIVRTSGKRIVVANPAAARILGYASPEELIAEVSDLRELYADPVLYRVVIERLEASGELKEFDMQLKRKDGMPSWLTVSGRALRDPDGELIGAECVFLDITERKRAEDLLRRGYERELAAGERLRDLDEMKNGFLRAVSHELRTPLAAILVISETLASWGQQLSQERVAQLGGTIHVNTRRLDRLLADVLDVDRLSRGMVVAQRRRIELHALVRTAVENLDLAGHPVHLAESEPLLASVDPGQVERIVENLVMNAVRHTPEGTLIWVHALRGGDGVTLTVEDAGPGVPDDERVGIFEPFRRGASSDRTPGTGVGLSLVARFAALHGGRAWVEDRDGGGAAFHVFLSDGDAPVRRAE